MSSHPNNSIQKIYVLDIFQSIKTKNDKNHQRGQNHDTIKVALSLGKFVCKLFRHQSLVSSQDKSRPTKYQKKNKKLNSYHKGKQHVY